MAHENSETVKIDKRRTLSTRVTARTRERLEAECEASGRSLSQEIELRLEMSFWDDGMDARVSSLEVRVRALEPGVT